MTPLNLIVLQAIYLVNRSHHGAVVKCEAANDIGTTQKETTLDVHCKCTVQLRPLAVADLIVI